jgi:hypothetical protein
MPPKRQKKTRTHSESSATDQKIGTAAASPPKKAKQSPKEIEDDDEEKYFVHVGGTEHRPATAKEVDEQREEYIRSLTVGDLEDLLEEGSIVDFNDFMRDSPRRSDMEALKRSLFAQAMNSRPYRESGTVNDTEIESIADPMLSLVNPCLSLEMLPLHIHTKLLDAVYDILLRSCFTKDQVEFLKRTSPEETQNEEKKKDEDAEEEEEEEEE